jgi:hypothetical protein
MDNFTMGSNMRSIFITIAITKTKVLVAGIKYGGSPPTARVRKVYNILQKHDHLKSRNMFFASEGLWRPSQ